MKSVRSAAILSPLASTGTGVSLPVHVLQIRTLGALEIWLDGTPLQLPFARCGELIVWLALHGPSNRSKIIDALWDGSNNPSHLEYFRVVVRRTRAALGQHLNFNPLEFKNKLYGLAEPLTVRVDASEILGDLGTNHLESLQNALEMYRGEFMPDVQREWVQIWRTVTLDHALALALHLAEKLETGQPILAQRIYQRAVEFEPYSELAHQGLIRMYERLDEPVAAIAARRTYNRLVHQELNHASNSSL
jgi:LuxR family transcriptional regulator, maltose regulon positive regulatory protein